MFPDVWGVVLVPSAGFMHRYVPFGLEVERRVEKLCSEFRVYSHVGVKREVRRAGKSARQSLNILQGLCHTALLCRTWLFEFVTPAAALWFLSDSCGPTQTSHTPSDGWCEVINKSPLSPLWVWTSYSFCHFEALCMSVSVSVSREKWTGIRVFREECFSLFCPSNFLIGFFVWPFSYVKHEQRRETITFSF